MFPWIERHREASRLKEPVMPQPAPWPQPIDESRLPEPETIKEDSFPADEAEIIIPEEEEK